MNDERIDFSAIDPARDRARWDARVQQTALRARALAARKTVAWQLRAWARPALAIAASLAIVSWAGALVCQRGQAPSSATTGDPALELAALAAGSETPSAARILSVLGDSHGAK